MLKRNHIHPSRCCRPTRSGRQVDRQHHHFTSHFQPPMLHSWYGRRRKLERTLSTQPPRLITRIHPSSSSYSPESKDRLEHVKTTSIKHVSTDSTRPCHHHHVAQLVERTAHYAIVEHCPAENEIGTRNRNSPIGPEADSQRSRICWGCRRRGA
jgi:hypothetical protein